MASDQLPIQWKITLIGVQKKNIVIKVPTVLFLVNSFHVD